MEKVKILVVEDKVIIAQSIITMIEKMGYQCVGTAIRAVKALELAKQTKPDLALLDINLKGAETGIWLAKELKKELNIPFIFITSFGDEKTIKEATATMPYGYLLKPITKQGIYAAIATALSRFSSEKALLPTQNNVTLTGHETKVKVEENDKFSLRIKDALFLKDEYQYIKIILSNIDFIKSDGNYIEIHGNGKKKVLKDTLKNIELKLPSNTFFKVHRSFIVNVSKIQSIKSTSIKVNNVEIPVVKEKKDILVNLLTS